MTTAKNKYAIGLHIWVNEDSGHFLGKGRIQLLENIKSTGSITKGAGLMKMSYPQAWQMVQDMNSRADQPLVEKILGGKGGGGAIVTDAGNKAIRLFYGLEEKLSKYATQLSEKIKL